MPIEPEIPHFKSRVMHLGSRPFFIQDSVICCAFLDQSFFTELKCDSIRGLSLVKSIYKCFDV